VHILLYSYNFSPEKAGIGKYNGELAIWLAQQGHQVDVITAPPYYPEWQVHANYSNDKWRVEHSANLTVYRCPMYVPKHVTGKTRLLSELSFTCSSFLVWLRLSLSKPRYDLVIAIYPPISSGLFPYLYSRIFKSTFVFHVQDLQVDAAAQLGIIKSSFLLNILKRFERFLLRKADLVCSISEGMKGKLVEKGVPPENYCMLENWVDLDFIKPQPFIKTFRLRNELGIKEFDKVILYSGNLGEKQGLEIVLQAAALLAERKEWRFIFCGDGVAKAKLVKMAADLELTNVHFCPLFPYERLPELLSLGDLHLVPQKRAAADLVLPSKLTGILAVGGLAMVSAEKGTSLFNTIQQNNIGIVVEPEDCQTLADAIVTALTGDFSIQKNNAFQYAQLYLNKDLILGKFEDRVYQIKNLKSKELPAVCLHHNL
jgi:colanic acid biosynthesis glycosyl transferase WcaI